MPETSLDSLEDLTVTRLRGLGLTPYEATTAVQRMQQLNIGIQTEGPFIYADNERGCHLGCKRVDILVVQFGLDRTTGHERLNVAAFTCKRPGLLASWRYVPVSLEIRRAADSLLVLSHRPS